VQKYKSILQNILRFLYLLTYVFVRIGNNLYQSFCIMILFSDIFNKIINNSNSNSNSNTMKLSECEYLFKIFITDSNAMEQCRNIINDSKYESDIRIKKIIRIKYETLDKIFSNQFIHEYKKPEILNIFGKLQRIYWAFTKLARIWKLSKWPIQVDYDMCLTPINRNSTPHIILWQMGAGYVFKIADLLKICHSALINCPHFFVDPLEPKNPYINKPFNRAELYEIYYAIRNRSMYKIPHLFQLFYECEFDMQRFTYENEAIIRDEYIKEFTKNSTSGELYPYIRRMFRYLKIDSELRIHKDFPIDKFVNIMRPYVYLYLFYIYSLSTTDKKYSSLYKLQRKMNEFIEYNPMFGRKMMVKCNHASLSFADAFNATVKYRSEFNDSHPIFIYSDAYNVDICFEPVSENREGIHHYDNDTMMRAVEDVLAASRLIEEREGENHGGEMDVQNI